MQHMLRGQSGMNLLEAKQIRGPKVYSLTRVYSKTPLHQHATHTDCSLHNNSHNITEKFVIIDALRLNEGILVPKYLYNAVVLYGQSLLHRLFHWKSFAVTN